MTRINVEESIGLLSGHSGWNTLKQRMFSPLPACEKSHFSGIFGGVHSPLTRSNKSIVARFERPKNFGPIQNPSAAQAPRLEGSLWPQSGQFWNLDERLLWVECSHSQTDCQCLLSRSVKIRLIADQTALNRNWPKPEPAGVIRLECAKGSLIIAGIPERAGTVELYVIRLRSLAAARSREKGCRGRALCLHAPVGLGTISPRALWPDVRGRENWSGVIQSDFTQKAVVCAAVIHGREKWGDRDRTKTWLTALEFACKSV
jgi:hypothetical protein